MDLSRLVSGVGRIAILVASGLLFVEGIIAATNAGRATVVLDGTWQIAESRGAEEMPREYSHSVAVPGLVHNSVPPFAGVDLFDSRELIGNRDRAGKLPASAIVQSNGISRQERNYFWYRRTFRVPVHKAVATL